MFQNCNASSIHKIKKDKQRQMGESGPKAENPRQIISEITAIISIPTSSQVFCLDDENMTKSVNVTNLKENATRRVNQDLENLTKNVLDQKTSNLCVPISVTTLLRHAIKNDLGFDGDLFDDRYSAERILATLTLIIYPRSMAGINLIPNEEETAFQHNEIELLLERLCKNTYLMENGWEIIRRLTQNEKDYPKKSTCKFEKGEINR